MRWKCMKFERSKTRQRIRKRSCDCMASHRTECILIGDSGGDGPHFEWGASVGAYLVGSMTKPSLESYCRKKEIKINTRFGVSYSEGEKKDPAREMEVDFMGLVSVIEKAWLDSEKMKHWIPACAGMTLKLKDLLGLSLGEMRCRQSGRRGRSA